MSSEPFFAHLSQHIQFILSFSQCAQKSITHREACLSSLGVLAHETFLDKAMFFVLQMFTL